MPSLEAYTQHIQSAWDAAWLTNQGPLVRRLTERIAVALRSSEPVLTCNGTVPLQIALNRLAGRGEVITTPFSFIATASSIAWEGCTPVFVDIDPEHLTIDETLIEAAITPQTTAILATHVFGNPSAIEAIEDIARRHNLFVLYDAAHCFGVEYKGRSLFEYGDVSTCSFHATKLFHTAEGGAMFVPDESLKTRLRPAVSFGQIGPDSFDGPGINAKMSEPHAAMGLAVLDEFPRIREERRRLVALYHELLTGSGLRYPKIREGTTWNHAYMPVLFANEASLLACMERLRKEGIESRRYFYPSLDEVAYLPAAHAPVSHEVSRTILCLPLYVGLEDEQVERIVKILRAALLESAEDSVGAPAPAPSGVAP